MIDYKALPATTARMSESTDLFDNPDYSDLTIRFGDQEVKVHKVIVCTRLRYFETLCGKSSKFKEANQSTIELFDDDPDAMRAMLWFLYTREFDPIITPASSTYVSFSTKVFVVASKYGCKTLQDKAAEALDDAYNKCGGYRNCRGVADLLAAMAVAFDSATNGDCSEVRHSLHELCLEIVQEDVHANDPIDRVDWEPLLDFLASHPEAAQYFAAETKEDDDLVVTKMFQCPGCGNFA